jgi:outer membrane protein OmpA-like peptidoglycan-associated protein
VPAAARRRGLVAALLASTTVLAACTGEGDTAAAPTSSPTPSPSSATPAADEAVATVALTVGGGVLDVDVLPLVRLDGPPAAPDLVALTLDLSVAAPAPDGGAPTLDATLTDLRRGGLREGGGLRLLDLASDRVHLAAADAGGTAVATAGRTWSVVRAEGTTRLQVLFAAPPDDVPAVSLLVPGAPLVDAVPVVDGELPPPEPGDDAPSAGAATPSPDAPVNAGEADLAPDPAEVATASVVPLDVFTTELDGAVRTLATEERARVDLAADVLFAVDAAALTPQAQEALAAAAAEVRGRSPAAVQVVGHTDDQGAPAYNLDLSRRRAQAVADALAPLLGGDYPLEVQARGETEPLAAGTDEQARALNRRVTLSLTAPPQDEVPAEAVGALPPAPELTATGSEGVVVALTRPFRVRVPSVRRVQGHLVADVEVSPEDEEVGSPFGPGSLLGSSFDPRGGYDPALTSTARSVVLLQGSTAVHPMDHVLDPADPSVRLCTCDPDTNGRLDAGQTTVSTVVFPEVPVGATVTLQKGDRGPRGFRLTDVPVR